MHWNAGPHSTPEGQIIPDVANKIPNRNQFQGLRGGEQTGARQGDRVYGDVTQAAQLSLESYIYILCSCFAATSDVSDMPDSFTSPSCSSSRDEGLQRAERFPSS